MTHDCCYFSPSNMPYVQHFSYEIDDDYTALYKGMPAELLPVAMFTCMYPSHDNSRHLGRCVVV